MTPFQKPTTPDDIEPVDLILDETDSFSLPDHVIEVNAEAYQSAYEQIVRPDRAIYLPGYFRRWLKIIGPGLAWMYVAFRQLAYLAGVRRGSKSNRFTGKAIAALAGITERTYWNRVGNSDTWEKLNGLVQIIKSGKEWDVKSPTPKRLPRRFVVAMTLPLTPADAASLRKWIVKHMETLDGAEAVLRAAIEAPLEELIPEDAEASEGDQPATVRQLVHKLFHGQLDEKLLIALASAIQTHIMVPTDLIVIPVYFLEHVLQHLGAGPGWMLTLLRDQGFMDRETNEYRNRVTVNGGYAEIAGWMGMSRPITIYEWLHGKKDEKFREPVLRAYVREIQKGEKELDFALQPRTFDFLFEDAPAGIVEAALTKTDLHKVFNIKNHPVYANFSIGFTRISEDDYATFSIGFTRFAEDIYATFIDISLNPLFLTPTSSTDQDKAPEPEPQPKPQKTAAAVDSDWELEKLLQLNSVHPKTQKAVLENGATAQVFIAHLLFAFSKGNESIKRPLSFALDQLRTNPNPPDELASMPKSILVAMLSGEKVDHPLAATWRKLMGSEGSKTPRYRELLPILLGDAAPTQEELRERKQALQVESQTAESFVPNPLPRPANLPRSKFQRRSIL